VKKKGSYLNLEVAFQQAAEKFARLDPAAAARQAGCTYHSEGCLEVPFLNQDYRVDPASGKAYLGGSEAPLYHNIILLHYLVTADGTPLTGEWISYRHLPGGEIYMEPFQRRAVIPFLQAFGYQPELFEQAALSLGGYRAPMGKPGMVVPVLPRVPLAFVLWPGDDEFAPTANILFDARAASYLPTEDYAHLPALALGAMKASLQR
jgi:hypothetical protein